MSCGEYLAVADAQELKPGQMKRIEVAGRKLLLCRTDNAWYCVDEMCSHEEYSLYFGCIEGGTLRCSLHGSRFDLASGRALDEPAEQPLRTYPLRLASGRIWVCPVPTPDAQPEEGA